MAVTAHKCVEKGCKGYVVFDNADFNYERIPEVNGMYVFDNPCCSECKKEYKVVPSYAVLLMDGKGGFTESNSACINDFEKREKEREFENETDPYEKIKKFIELRGYSYSVESVIEGYISKCQSNYISYTMKDCVSQLEEELKELTGIV